MKITGIDFETYYHERDFTLKKMTTEAYIRDPQFEVIGVALQTEGERPKWFSGTKAQTKEFLESWNLHENIALAHNAAFDMAILNWHFDIRPKRIADTLSMARAIHGTEVGGSLKALAEYYKVGVKGEEVGKVSGMHRIDFDAESLARYGVYCENDVDLTIEIFKKMVGDFDINELRLIDLTIRMFSEPVLQLNTPFLTSYLKEVKDTKESLLSKMLITKEQLMSNPKLAEVLTSLGVEPPMKTSPTTGKPTFAFAKNDEEFKALLEHENVIVQNIVAARLGVKSTLEETRTQRFVDIAGRGLLPVPLRYYAAHTGRWGGDDKINMQNLGRGSKLKYAIQAPPDHMIINSDSSQIEARTLAWLAEQNDLVDAFERGEDVYKIMASSIYGKDINDITKDERFVGKTTILGCGYGMGAKKFQAQLKTFGVDMELKEAERIIDVYRSTYEWIPVLWQQAGRALEAIMSDQTAPLGRTGVLVVEGKKGIRLPNGMYLKYPNLRVWTRDGKSELVYDTKKGKTTTPTKVYGGKVIENVCQALARIAIGEQLLMVAKKYKVAMTVHDAVTAVVPQYESLTAKEYVELCMRIRPSWAPDLPLNCESGVGKSYGEA
jgi:DNA polymerase I-like protein with 3'-5' exonuclease and polymerase domains